MGVTDDLDAVREAGHESSASVDVAQQAQTDCLCGASAKALAQAGGFGRLRLDMFNAAAKPLEQAVSEAKK